MIPIKDDPLAPKMRKLAERCSPEVGRTLNLLADDLDRAIGDWTSPDAAKKILGAWARARRVYTHFTGEPFI